MGAQKGCGVGNKMHCIARHKELVQLLKGHQSTTFNTRLANIYHVRARFILNQYLVFRCETQSRHEQNRHLTQMQRTYMLI